MALDLSTTDEELLDWLDELAAIDRELYESDVVTVWRVEQSPAEDGGPYTFKGARDSRLMFMKYTAHNDAAHPGPYNDAAFDWRSFTSAHVFGFESREDLVAWFAGYLPLLHSVGFTVSEYTVAASEVIYGTGQLAFRRRAATHVATYDLRVDA
jgi:hypothetical protein